MKISLIHPSRGRSKKAKFAHDYWLLQAHGEVEIEYILSLDTDDPDGDKYLEWVQGSANLKICSNPNKNLVQAANAGAKIATGDILILVSDDFRCPTSWDAILLANVEDKKDWIMKTQDGVQAWIITLPIMDREYYNRFGYIYNPDYSHLYCDTEMTHVADLLGRKIICPAVFPHDHYSVTGSAKDAISEKADSTWAQGEQTYLQNVKNKFGLGDIDVFKLPPEGKPTIDWIKNKQNIA